MTLTEILISAVQAGAVVSSSAVIEEATKDAYRALKETVGSVFGRRALRAAEKLETDPSAAAREDLAAAITEVPAEDADELKSKITALLAALRSDEQARGAVARAQIDLDLEAGGNILLESIENARSIGVKVKSEKDFTMRDVKMSDQGSGSTGN